MEQQESSAQYAPGQYVDPRAQLHSGVGQFMAGVYMWMAVGVGITAAVATAMSMNVELLLAIHGTGLKWLFFFGPIAFIWILGDRIPTMDRKLALGTFLVYAAMIGAMISYIPFVYQMGTVASAFGTAAIAFAGLAGYGYFTKRDLSPFRQILMIGVLGVFAAVILSAFVPGISLVVSVIGVVVFGALTAYHTQSLRQIYMQQGGAGNLEVVGALSLYAAFMNIFLFLLRIFASRD